MEDTLILAALAELYRVRVLLTACVVFGACAVVLALVALGVYLARSYDKMIDAADREIEQGGG